MKQSNILDLEYDPQAYIEGFEGLKAKQEIIPD